MNLMMYSLQLLSWLHCEGMWYWVKERQVYHQCPDEETGLYSKDDWFREGDQKHPAVRMRRHM